MEEDLYRLDDPATTISRSNGFNVIAVTSDFHTSTTPIDHLVLQFDHQAADHRTDMPDLIKTQIANHPRYPNLVSAYIECRKVGAPPELASFLEEIGRENHRLTGRNEIGADPELDDFMETYCEVLHRFKEELSKPLDEATMFLSNMESQLSHLCQGALTRTLDYRSDEDLSSDEVEASESSDHNPSQEDIKGMLIRKYSGCLSNLRNEFLKKRKKGKLPKDARMTLLHWWNNHYRWPYPTEEEKLELSEITGLDQKQINNWFINQRKRHWKPTEDVKFALTEAVAGNDNGEPT